MPVPHLPQDAATEAVGSQNQGSSGRSDAQLLTVTQVCKKRIKRVGKKTGSGMQGWVSD